MWYIVAFLAGGFLGVIIMALMVAAKDQKEETHEDTEEQTLSQRRHHLLHICLRPHPLLSA